MKNLPEEYKLLKEIQSKLNKYLDSRNTQLEIRSNELYDVIKKNITLKGKFPTNRIFNQFLRKHHQKGVMKTFINYRVDDSNNNFYQWYFGTKHKTEKSAAKNTTVNQGTFNYYKTSKNIFASDGTKLNSKHEVHIYEKLIEKSHIRIDIEYPLIRNEETKFVDFTIKNKLTQKTYYWEHFGMTNSEEYKSKMADKIEWYKENGFKTIENGGDLILTYYSNDNNLEKDTKKYIEIITKTAYNNV